MEKIPRKARVKVATKPKKMNIKLIKKRVRVLRKTSQTLLKLSKEPIPTSIPSNLQNDAQKYNQWLKTSSGSLNALADTGDSLLEQVEQLAAGGSESAQLMLATKEMQEMNQSFNLQYLALQQKMQADNRQFTLLSNIMKTKHDTAKNAINNVR